MPVETVRLLRMDILLVATFAVMVEDGLIIRLLKLVTAELLMVWLAVPLKVTVLVAGVKVPEFVQFPPTYMEGELLHTKVAGEEIVRPPLAFRVPPDWM